MPSSRRAVVPPRPMSPGDVVATFSPDLGSSTAAHVIALIWFSAPSTSCTFTGRVHGPPASLGSSPAERPLRGVRAASSREWVLPRSSTLGHRKRATVAEPPLGDVPTGLDHGEALRERQMASTDPERDRAPRISIGAHRLKSPWRIPPSRRRFDASGGEARPAHGSGRGLSSTGHRLPPPAQPHGVGRDGPPPARGSAQ